MSPAESGRPSHPSRRIFLPRNFEDPLPADEDTNHTRFPMTHPSLVTGTQNPPHGRIQRILLTLRDTLQTASNAIGLSRLYPRRPSFEPDNFIPSLLLAKSSPVATDVHNAQGPDQSPGVSEPPYPFANMSIYRLMTWMNSGSHQKSQTEVMRLVTDVIQAKDFDPKDLDGFSVRRCLRALDNDRSKETVTFPDDWIETDVPIEIPSKSKDDQPTLFNIAGFHYRPLVAVIRAAFADIQANTFHISPFKRLWKDPLDNHEERVFDELYTSDAWLEAQDDLQRQPKERGCSLERVVAGLMLFSDATHLANFGTAKAWPLYLYFGNLSKYIRAAPGSGACHLVGFLPSVCCLLPMSWGPINVSPSKLPDSVKDILRSLPRISKSGITALNAHCRRELFHSCWKILLDPEFLHAYRHGIVLQCPDGIFRRVFPRIFTYSADYPEKCAICLFRFSY